MPTGCERPAFRAAQVHFEPEHIFFRGTRVRVVPITPGLSFPLPDMTDETAAQAQGASLEFKSAFLTVVALVLKTTDMSAIEADLSARLDEDRGFFDQDALLIDLDQIRAAEGVPDFARLVVLLRAHGTLPVVVRGGSSAQMQAAQAAGLAPVPDELPARPAAAAPASGADRPPRRERKSRAAQAVPAVEVRHEVQPPAAGGAPTVVIDKPLRSGQQVYARGADLVVMDMVSFGAEVIADGNIHVYAPLRGRAIAGARGNTSARIFSTCLEPQLVSIAGIYRTSENDLPNDLTGKPAQVRLDGEKLLIEPLA